MRERGTLASPDEPEPLHRAGRDDQHREDDHVVDAITNSVIEHADALDWLKVISRC